MIKTIGFIALGFVLIGANSRSEPVKLKLDKKTIAIEIAKTRVKIAEVDFEGAVKEYDLVTRKLKMMDNLKLSKAMSCDEHIEVSRIYFKSLTDMKRAEARVEEAKALLKYTENVGEVDLSLTLR